MEIGKEGFRASRGSVDKLVSVSSTSKGFDVIFSAILLALLSLFPLMWPFYHDHHKIERFFHIVSISDFATKVLYRLRPSGSLAVSVEFLNVWDSCRFPDFGVSNTGVYPSTEQFLVCYLVADPVMDSMCRPSVVICHWCGGNRCILIKIMSGSEFEWCAK
jgi:hypothetical protein